MDYVKLGRTSTNAVAALSLRLGPEEIADLEAEYVPHGVVGFR